MRQREVVFLFSSPEWDHAVYMVLALMDACYYFPDCSLPKLPILNLHPTEEDSINRGVYYGQKARKSFQIIVPTNSMTHKANLLII